MVGIISGQWGIASVLWRIFSILGDTVSTVGDNISTVEGIQYSGGKNFNFGMFGH